MNQGKLEVVKQEAARVNVDILGISKVIWDELQRYYFANKGPSSQGYGFSSGHVWM